MRRLLVALGLALVVVAPARAEAPLAEPAECWVEANVFQDVDCYRVVLPRDRANPEAGTVSLPVAVLRASTDTPAPDPVIYLEGGPGGPTFASGYPDEEDYSGFWWRHSTPFRRHRDFILFDQRGIGLAEPSLDCPEVHRVDAQIRHLPGAGDPVFEAELRALRHCHDRLVAEGLDLDDFSTPASADDVADIARALGYDRVNLYGASYGTRLALEVMRRHPGLVRAAVLDGVYPPDADLELEFAQSVATAFGRLFADCAADAACRRVAPEAEARLARLVGELDRRPRELELYDRAFFDPGTMVLFDGTTVLSSMVDTLYDSAWLPWIPLVVGTADREEIDALSYFYWAPTLASGGLSEGSFVNVTCRETPTLDSARLADAVRDHGIYGDVAWAWSFLPYCEVWPVARAPHDRDGPVRSEIPTLLMSGVYDPVTPPAFAERAKATLPDSVHLVFRSGGHAVSFAFDCARDAAADFLADPDPAAVAPPRCRAYDRPPAFPSRF